MSPQRWEAHSKTKSTVSGRERRPREQCSIWQEEGSGQQGLHSNHSSFLRQAPSQGPLSPVEVCDSWGSSRRGIPLYPTGEGRHLPLSPYTSSCHVLGHQCFKIYWFLAGCLLKNQKTSSFKFIPTAFALTSRQSIPVQTAPRRSRPTVDSLFHISS